MNTRKHNSARRLARAGIQFAAVLLGIYLLAAVAALDLPAVLLAVLIENALLGAYFALEEVQTCN